MRSAVLFLALALIGGLAFLTVRVMVTEGIDVLVLVSILVLAMLASGVIGALTTPPDE